MKTWKTDLAVAASCLLAMFSLTSCGDDGSETDEMIPQDELSVSADEKNKDANYSIGNETLLDRIQQTPDLSLFVEVLKRSGYDKMLSTYGAITVFAPTNESMKAYGDNLTDSLCIVIAKRHIVGQVVMLSSLAIEQHYVTNLLGESLSVNAEHGVFSVAFISNSQNVLASIVNADMDCFNGRLNIVGFMTVTDESQKTEESTPTVVAQENFWENKHDMLGVLSSCYLGCMDFEKRQLQLEALRSGNTNSHHAIYPYTNEVAYAFSAAYIAINRINYLLGHLPTAQEYDAAFSFEEMQSYIAEARGLRAFIYYNIAMLWGRVFLLTDPIITNGDAFNSQSNTAPTEQNEVYAFAYHEICEALNHLNFSYDDANNTEVARFTRNAGLMLKAEIELTIGRRNEAQNTLNDVTNFFGFTLITEGQSLPIYTPAHLTLFQKEAAGDTEELVQWWAATEESRYGYWATLKRLGKAQEVTGCFDFELLMPYPDSELRNSSQLTQNPGYSEY